MTVIRYFTIVRQFGGGIDFSRQDRYQDFECTDRAGSHQRFSCSIGLSQTPTVNRIRKLEDLGVIKGYQAHLSEALLGGAISVFTWVSLVDQKRKTLSAFEKVMELSPEVMDCFLMTGDADYLLRIAVDGLDEFERFLTERLAGLSEVRSIRSSFALRPVIQKRRPPRLSRQMQNT
jgi:Lrp/AsnC family leucine-responsive transcriptional regulator